MFSARVAPELLRNEAYDLRLDWWCLGVIAYIMLVGKYPYSRVRWGQGCLSHDEGAGAEGGCQGVVGAFKPVF
jgi:hypothetical protein